MNLTENHQFKFAFVSKVIIIALGILSGAFINRFLGPSLKGEYTFLLNTIYFFAMFLNLGIYQSYPYFRRQGIKNLEQIYINIVFFQFLVYIFISLISILFLQDFSVKFTVFLIPLLVLNNQLTFLFLVKSPNLRNFALIINNISFVILLLFLYVFAERTIFYMYLIIILQVIILIIILLLLFRIKINPFKVNFKHLKASIKFGFFPMLTSVLIFLNANIDIFILKLYVNFYDIGIYSIGIGLSSMVWSLTDSFKEVLFSKTSKDDSIPEIKFSLKINFYLSILLLVLFIIFGEFLIEFLYGIEFVNAYIIVIILFIGNIPMIFYKIIMTLFLAQGKKVLIFVIISLSISFGLFGFFLFIPLYGIIGSAFAATISHSICGLLFLLYFLKFEEVTLKDLLMIKKEDVYYIFR